MVNGLYLNTVFQLYNAESKFLMQNYIPVDPTKAQLSGTVDFSTFNLNFNDVLSASKNSAWQITGDLTTIANYTDDNVPFEGRNGLVFITGHDSLLGGSGNDVLSGDFYSFFFTVDGNPVQGNNKLVAGNDTIDGGNGDDLIFGDVAREGSMISAHPDFSTGITELYGHDTLLGGNGNDVIYGDEGVRSSVGAFQHHYLYDGNDHIAGGNGNDVLVGDKGAVILRTVEGSGDASHLIFQGGNDFIAGDNGNDLLIGDYDLISLGRITGTAEVRDNLFQMGNDILSGGNGNDILIGDYNVLDNLLGFENVILGGNDILTGGNGADTFVFNALHNGNDVITDFNYKEGDKIVINDGGADHAGIKASAQGHDTLINLNNLGTILLQNVSLDKVVSVDYMADHGMLIIT